MTKEEKMVSEASEEKVTGGAAPEAPTTPKHNGDICPECGMCRVRFVRFQFYQGRWQEYCECSYCGPVLFNV